MKNLGLRALSLLIGILLTLYVNRESNNTNFSFLVGVELKNTPKNRVIVEQSVSQVQVTVRGPSYLVSKIPESPPTFHVEVPTDVGPAYRATLLPSDLGFPSVVDVVSIEPKEIELAFENRLSKTVPVVVNSKGNIRETLKIRNVKASPENVEIVGPEGEVKAITNAETDPPIDLASLTESITREVEIRVPGRLTKPLQSKALVSVQVSSVEDERKLNQLPVQVRTAAGVAFSVTPYLVAVEVSGPKSKIAGLKREDIVPYVRPPEAEEWESGEIEVAVDLPKDISLVMVEPTKVMVTRINSAKQLIPKGRKK